MRSAILVSAAFALGALAVPNKRDAGYVFTEVDIVEKTVTVYVTATGLPPVSVSEAAVSFSEAVKHYSHSHHHHQSSSSSIVPVKSSVKSSVVAPSSSSSTSVYTPPASSAPVSTPEPSSTTPEPSSTTPKPSSTAAPVSSVVQSSVALVSPASSGIGPAHVEGDAQADLTSGEDYQNMILFHHNVHRANHSAGALTWDSALASKAADCARCKNWPFHHCNAMQNMAASGPIANVSAGITEGWYNGEMPNYAPYYGLKDPTGNLEEYGHATQVVWAEATKVGCGTVDCRKSSGMWVTVCNYDAGNMEKDWGNNVHKPSGAAECHWDD